MDLSHKSALVTGSSQGIGRAIAAALASRGARVLINTLPENAAAAETVAADIRAAGGRAALALFDVTDETAVNQAFADAGSLDILVNNARIDPWQRRPELSDGEWWSQVMEVNLKGAFLCAMAFMAQARRRNWGRIINISSVRAYRPAEINMIAYAASKAGMHALTRALADNGAPHGITANAVAPGMVITENIDKRLSPEKCREETAAIPLGRGATTEEIADAVLFLTGNGYVTGEILNINGGMYYAP